MTSHSNCASGGSSSVTDQLVFSHCYKIEQPEYYAWKKVHQWAKGGLILIILLCLEFGTIEVTCSVQFWVGILFGFCCKHYWCYSTTNPPPPLHITVSNHCPQPLHTAISNHYTPSMTVIAHHHSLTAMRHHLSHTTIGNQYTPLFTHSH